MDNQKLLQILLKDAGDLEKIISEIREAGSIDPLDMEFLQTRISGFRHLLEVACRTEVVAKPVEKIQTSPNIKEIKPEEVVIPTLVAQPVETFPKNKKEKKAENREPVKEPTATVPKPDAPVEAKPVEETAAIVTSTSEALPDEVKLPKEEKHILAEKFVAGKSINDLLQEKSKTDSKFPPMPLSSLAAGIGTNERFLFTRELFNGDMERFNETIHTLDGMQSIQEATGFLRESFSWDKNETSLRFIELIRRRFAQ